MESIARKILDFNAMSMLDEEIEALQDASEKEIRRNLLDAIWNSISKYDEHILDLEYRQYLQTLSERGLEFIPVEMSTVAAQWDELFATRVSEQAKKQSKRYNDQYKWHIFSFYLLESLSSEEARVAFDQQEKDTVYLFFQYAPEAYLIKNASLLKAEDLDFDNAMDRSDLYIFDPVENWTYVQTHEESCGPYFFSVNEGFQIHP